MLDWYRSHARKLLARRIDRYLPAFVKMGASVEPKIIYRRMKKRWGSCSVNGTVMVNTELVKAPLNCIDYVIIHELTHLLYPNHDKNFYQLLGLLLPDWEKRKVRLEQVVI